MLLKKRKLVEIKRIGGSRFVPHYGLVRLDANNPQALLE